MHVHPWHLPRRKWLIRHVGRCQGNGGKESAKEFFQGSGAQENSKVFKLKAKHKDARIFKSFNFEEQFAIFTVSPSRSNEEDEKEGEFDGGIETESKHFDEVVGAFDEDAGRLWACGGRVETESGNRLHVGCGNEAAVGEEAGGLHIDEIDGGFDGDAGRKRACSGRVETESGNQLHDGRGKVAAVDEEASVGMGCVRAGGTDQEAKILLEVEESEAVDTMGNVHSERNHVNSSDMVIMGHLHAHSPIVGSSGVGSACVGSSVGVLGAPGWSVGRWSARLSSPWCCPGCGLYGDGSLCMTCDTHGTRNSCIINSVQNLRSVRRPEHREETKLLKASSGIQVGFPVVDNVPGNASLVDYLRWAPKEWPVEGWECRTVLTPWVDKVNIFLAGGCEVVSTIMQVSEWYSVSTGPGEPLRTALGWTPLLHTPSSGVWLFRGAVRGSSYLLR